MTTKTLPMANKWLRLMRLDRPIGTYLLLWPTYWALWFAAEGRPSLSNLVIFTLGVVVMRAAGCVIMLTGMLMAQLSAPKIGHW